MNKAVTTTLILTLLGATTALVLVFGQNQIPFLNNQANISSGIIIGELEQPATKQQQEVQQEDTDNAQVVSNSTILEPIAEFKQRITKKYFGLFITPQTSPVQPDKFNGYHNGVDIEYEGVAQEIPVLAITDGTVVFSDWVNGYGGVVVLRHTIENKDYFVLYGHLNPATLAQKNTKVKAGATIGVLGEDHSEETDGARKHLHFSVRPAENGLSLRGYVDSQEKLNEWIDPLTLY